jgi:hypothetical protein
MVAKRFKSRGRLKVVGVEGKPHRRFRDQKTTEP